MVADYSFDMKNIDILFQFFKHNNSFIANESEVYGFFAILLKDQNIKLSTPFTATLEI